MGELNAPPTMDSKTVASMNSRQDEDRKVVEALNDLTGISITSIFDLVNGRATYTQAIPVLISFVKSGLRDPLIMEGVVRALTIKEAKGSANEPLLELFNRTSKTDTSLRWAIGNAFKTILLPQDKGSILQIIKDKENGVSRQEFVSCLAKIKSSEADDLLVTLLDDADVSAHALEALRKKRSSLGIEKAKLLLEHPKTVIRKEAQKYLKSLK